MSSSRRRSRSARSRPIGDVNGMELEVQALPEKREILARHPRVPAVRLEDVQGAAVGQDADPDGRMLADPRALGGGHHNRGVGRAGAPRGNPASPDPIVVSLGQAAEGDIEHALEPGQVLPHREAELTGGEPARAADLDVGQVVALEEIGGSNEAAHIGLGIAGRHRPQRL